jgi:hypothetical protein
MQVKIHAKFCQQIQREYTARMPKHKWTDTTKLATERIRVEGIELESTIPGYGPAVRSCEQSNYPAGSRKGREFVVRFEVPSTVKITLQSSRYDAM